eukprot:1958024-Rhodomonas_salina.2
MSIHAASMLKGQGRGKLGMREQSGRKPVRNSRRCAPFPARSSVQTPPTRQCQLSQAPCVGRSIAQFTTLCVANCHGQNRESAKRARGRKIGTGEGSR